MQSSEYLQLLFHGNQLKRTVRTGWVQRGVNEPENVAAHTFGVAYTALVLAQIISLPIDLEKLLIMALLHDLPEGMTTDIPITAWRLFPDGIKGDVERKAMNEIVGQTPLEALFMKHWEELNRGESAEAKLLHDADKLDLYLQALVYEEQTRNSYLDEFWASRHDFFFAEAQTVYDELISLRNKE